LHHREAAGTAPADDAGTLPATTANTLFVFLPDDVTVVEGNGASCQSFRGYHDSFGNGVYYAVIHHPACSGRTGGLAVLNALTSTTSHESCEAITAPIPGQGWYDDNNGEIGDICAWKTRTLGLGNYTIGSNGPTRLALGLFYVTKARGRCAGAILAVSFWKRAGTSLQRELLAEIKMPPPLAVAWCDDRSRLPPPFVLRQRSGRDRFSGKGSRRVPWQ